MKNYLLLILLACSFQNSFAALAIQKITNNDFPKIDLFNSSVNSDIAVINDELFFIIDGKIAKSDGSNQGTLILDIPTNSNGFHSKTIIAYKDGIAYINGDHIWFSNDTSTIKISEIMVAEFANLINIDDILFVNAKAEMGETLMMVNNEKVTVFNDLINPSIGSLCMMGNNNFFIRALELSEEKELIEKLVHVVDDEITDIMIIDNPQEAYQLVASFNNECYYSQQRELIKFDGSGVMTEISVPDAIHPVFSRFLAFNDQLYLINSLGIDVVDQSQLKLEHLFDFPSLFDGEERLIVTLAEKSENYLYVNVKTYFQPTYTVSMIFDDDINLLNSTNHSLSRTSTPAHIVSAGKEDFIINFKNDKIARGYSGLTDGTDLLDLKNNRAWAMAYAGNTAFVFVSTNGSFPRLDLYAITDKPLISGDLQGVWVSEQLKNQGLVISTGVRSDASEYIFVNLLLFRDGQPFWVAGSRDMLLAEESIKIELSEFTGSSFIEGEQAADTQTSFGNMTIEPSGCDSIIVSLEPVIGESIDLSMNRMVNENISNCAD